jgi:urease accessory protein
MVSQWLIWQLADSAFPSGGFAHSSGLEAAWHHGLVKDGASLAAFVGTGLRQCSRGSLSFVRATWNDPASFVSVDNDCDLFHNSHVANRASRAQGRALLASASRAFPVPQLADLSNQVRKARAAGHLAPVFGMVCASLGLSETETTNLFLFIFARGCLSSAVRLGIVGPLEAQQIQFGLAMEEESVTKCSSESAVQTSPMLDLLQATQDRLYSKLFQS